MRVGFLNNQVDNRGTGNALFDYAHYNETLLGNQSVIFSRDISPRDLLMENRLLERFGKIHDLSDNTWLPLDVLYHIKSGLPDGVGTSKRLRYAVHAVFDYQPHGDRYAVVSPWMGRKYISPFVPHIISLSENTDDLRSTLAIGQDAIVFGRHGGADSFDIGFAWTAINRALKSQRNIWFLFMNTNNPNIDFFDNRRVVFLEGTSDPLRKRAFINTCDAMLHARSRGETFGIAVGEFASLGKPIITYGLSPERNHLEEVMAYTYTNEDELYWHLVENEWLDQDKSEYWIGYNQYTPDIVMRQFKEVFLD